MWENSLGCSGSTYLQGRRGRLTAKSIFSPFPLWERNIVPQDRWSWCWFLLADSWAWHRASNAHHVVVPGFDRRRRSGAACLGTSEVRQEGERLAVRDTAASAAIVRWAGGAWLTREHNLLQPGKGQAKKKWVWLRISATAGKETLLGMSGFLNASGSLSQAHVSPKHPTHSLHGIKTCPKANQKPSRISLPVPYCLLTRWYTRNSFAVRLRTLVLLDLPIVKYPGCTRLSSARRRLALPHLPQDGCASDNLCSPLQGKAEK